MLCPWIKVNSVQFSSVSQSGLTFCNPVDFSTRASLSITKSRSLLKLMSIESVMHPTILSSVALLFFCLQSFYASGSFQIEHSGLISFKMDWLDLLSVQGTLKSLSNIAVQKHQFLGAQLSSQSNSHIHTWLLKKTKALARWTFVGKVMSLLFNMLLRLVIAFLPRSKCLFFMAAVTICSDFGAPQNKVCHCSIAWLIPVDFLTVSRVKSTYITWIV